MAMGKNINLLKGKLNIMAAEKNITWKKVEGIIIEAVEGRISSEKEGKETESFGKKIKNLNNGDGDEYEVVYVLFLQLLYGHNIPSD